MVDFRKTDRAEEIVNNFLRILHRELSLANECDNNGLRYTLSERIKELEELKEFVVYVYSLEDDPDC